MPDIQQPVPIASQPPIQPVQVNQPEPPKRTKIFWLVGIISLFLILGGSSGYYFLTSQKETPKDTAQVAAPPKVVNPTTGLLVTPTPMPFREMTIPYLREKIYDSQLGELEPAYDGNSYSAYLTSYTSDGLKINGLLTRPTGDAPTGGWPAIVFVHGYIPPNVYQTNGQAYSSYVDYLARNGFVVFKIDLRGHASSEGEPGGAYYSSDYIIDVLNARAALQKSDFVNPEKIGLWGHSMAGNVTLRSVATKPEIPALVIWAGAVYTYEDMIKYRITDGSYQPQPNNSERQRRRQQIYEKYGSPSASIQFWREVAPVSYLSEFKGAIQIHHAVDDDVVNVAYSRDLNSLLDKTSIQHDFFEYPSGGHNLTGASFNQAMQRTVEFYKQYLK